MKLNKFITVMLLSAVCVTSQQTTPVQCYASDTVISNQVTYEDSVAEEAGLEFGALADATTGAAVTSGTGVNASIFTMAVGSTVSVANDKLATSAVKDTVKSNTKKTATSAKKSKKTKVKKNYTANELKLMSCIIYCEAQGEPYAGKQAVGIVVMNRKSSKSFPNTIKGVIYQKYQFGPTRNGSMAKALRMYEAGKFNSPAAKSCVKAAKSVLNGNKKVTYQSKTINLSSFHFFSRRVSGARLTIKHHQFK